jgi:hypothetical protein
MGDAQKNGVYTSIDPDVRVDVEIAPSFDAK